MPAAAGENFFELASQYVPKWHSWAAFLLKNLSIKTMPAAAGKNFFCKSYQKAVYLIKNHQKCKSGGRDLQTPKTTTKTTPDHRFFFPTFQVQKRPLWSETTTVGHTVISDAI